MHSAIFKYVFNGRQGVNDRALTAQDPGTARLDFASNCAHDSTCATRGHSK